jgi:hypothetical protein
MKLPNLLRRCAIMGAICLTASAFLAACGGADGVHTLASPVPLRAVTLPIEISNNHASVAVLINGISKRFLLDTGADYNVVNTQTAAALNLPLSSERVPSSGGSGGIAPVPWTTIRELAMGRVNQRDAIAFVIPTPEEFTYDGILGANFFRAFSPRIDYQNKQLTLIESSAFVAPTGVAPIPVRLDASGKALVEASAAGVTGWYSVDSGAGNSLTLFTPTVERYGLRTRFAPSVRMATGIGTSGVDYSDVVRLPEIVIGPHRLPKVVAELSLATGGLFGSDGWSGNLGAELWRRFTITIDYPTKSLYLEPNAAYAEAFKGPRSGLTPRIEHGAIMVREIIRNSPAAEAGVQVGDTVLAVDGQALTAAALGTLSTALRQAIGTNVKLRLRATNNVEREVDVVLREFI